MYDCEQQPKWISWTNQLRVHIFTFNIVVGVYALFFNRERSRCENNLLLQVNFIYTIQKYIFLPLTYYPNICIPSSDI